MWQERRAHVRTSIALVSLGFVLAKFSVWLRQFVATVASERPGPHARLPRAGASLPAGLAMMAFGGLMAVVALTHHRAVDRAITRGEFRPAHRLTLFVAPAVVTIALVLIVYLLLMNQRL